MPLKRINRDEALRLLTRAPLIEVMARGDEARQRLHPQQEVSFVVDTNPNYTNVCITDCTFCSFYRKPGDATAWTLGPEEIARKAASAQERGATTVLLQGGHHPELRLEYFLDVIAAIQAAAPGLHLHLFSPSEIDHIARMSGLSWQQVLERFYEAGLRTMPGGGAEILVDRVRRQISPKKLRADDWLEIMGVAHRVGYRTSATMTYGHRETPEDIVEHLFRIREQQDKTGGFYAFIPWSFKPGASPLSRLVPESVAPSLYPRIIGLARLVLDNVPHIQASWFGEGRRAGQLALRAGADDFGGVLLEENVLFQAEHQHASSLQEVLRLIREARFTPVQRTTMYELVQRFEQESPGEKLSQPTLRVAGQSAHAQARARRSA